MSYEDYNLVDKRVYYVEASQGYKVVTVKGNYIDKSSNKKGTFTVLIDENLWSGEGDGFATTTFKDGITYQVNHDYYYSIFDYRIHDTLTNASNVSGGLKFSDAFQVSWWDTWGPTLISTAILLVVGFIIFSRLSSSVSGMNNSALGFNKSPAKKATSKVKFSDVAGCDEEKAEMVELVEYLKDPKKYSKFGARLPKGVLLIGPPGTGKTLLAKAVAGEAGVPFYSISGSDFVEMYVGVGAGRVRDLFRKAKETAPCLIFIDEIDAVGRQRGAGLGGGNDEREQTLNQLLVEMDGFEPNSGILVIAATNRDDVLDPALRRAGRFDRTITVSLPDKAGREAILKVHARNKKIDPAVDFAALAKRTVGFSGADLDNVLNEAAILAVRENKPDIDMADIDEAIDRRISGPAKSSRSMSPMERKEVAYHEAGHAVIGINLPFSDKVQKITIIPRGNTGGHVLMTPEDDRFLLTKNELIARITGLLGGRTSEEIFFQDVTTGASNDIQEATRIARLMVTELGMSELGPIQYEKDTGSVFLGRDYNSTQKNFSTQIAFEIDKAVRKIIDEAHENARKLLLEHKDQVILIAETLLEKETITAEEIEYLCKNGSLPKQNDAEPSKEETPKEEEKTVPSEEKTEESKQ
ncbi:MAG TPA: cell division protein FtsH [Firmicutes bacterium]|nr:cell division protein FtsH [Bacillota bacterium]HBM69994.1 cell division protein FtsH [Bacillota bacterium]HBX24988.1 cell division protein FtsH [Bacillota bacterium]